MNECSLPAEFESEPRVYGECVLDQCEQESMRLPPKFAVFKKINAFDCKAEVEKAFTKLKWKRTFEETGKPQNAKNSDETKTTLPSTTSTTSTSSTTSPPTLSTTATSAAIAQSVRVRAHNLKVASSNPRQ